MLFILGSHPLELWKALRRGMQMSVRATASARRLAEKAVVIGMVFAGLLPFKRMSKACMIGDLPQGSTTPAMSWSIVTAKEYPGFTKDIITNPQIAQCGKACFGEKMMGMEIVRCPTMRRILHLVDVLWQSSRYPHSS